jgi:MGT family glycosyltransferase
LRPVPHEEAHEDDLPAVIEDDGRPLVYVTFGTVFANAANIAAALEAVRELDVRVIVTVGPGGDPDALGPQPDNVTLVRYVPQMRLLPHCDLVVSHAGSGTFLASMGLGLPQLCLPQAADQFLNAAAGARAGATISLSPADATVPAIRAAAKQLLAESSFRERAADVARDIHAMPAPDEVVSVLEVLGARRPRPRPDHGGGRSAG